MILTLTANPTIDRVLFVRGFAMQDVMRAEREVVSPSGKGIDVSLILHELGAETLAIALNAGLSGEMLAALLAQRGLHTHLIAAQGETRIAALITDVADGRQSTILAPTLTAGPNELAALNAALTHYAPSAWGVVCAGSLPPGLPQDAWGQLIATGRQYGLVTLLDSSGEGLRRGMEAMPDILKINGRELQELAISVGDESPAYPMPDDLVPLARYLHTKLGEWASQAVVVTYGSRGIVAVTADEAHHIAAPPVKLVSAAGAGDAVAAGMMLARERGDGWIAATRLGIATAAAVVTNEGTAVCTAAQVAELIHQVPAPRLLEL